MSIPITSIGVKVSYAIEITKGVRPTTGFKKIPKITEIPEINPTPDMLDTTSMDNLEYTTGVQGLKTLDTLTFTARFSQELFDMFENETTWDKLLQIKTTGRDDSNSDQYRYPYEPTPYSVLERLANSGLIRKRDVVLDYGCGKGRVDFFLSYQTRAKTIGIEYDERIYQAAVDNQKNAVSGARTEFVLTRAEGYEVPSEVTVCYFFNPFSVELLRKVMARIVESYYVCPREITLCFYYPSEEYISYLMTVEEIEFYDEINCGDLFDSNDAREQIMIFRTV